MTVRMKRFQKKELLYIIELLQKLHLLIKRNMEQGNSETVYELLLECQQSAIDMGNAIEKMEETKETAALDAVTALEDYCEAVYQAAVRIQETVYAQLELSLQKVRDIIEKTDCGKLEVVFFPYKASMWDSLESIWEAAAADERVEVYVVPIPYFDKNPDGTFGEMHDESGLYPDYVPVCSWESYVVQERRPDMIFIHNPYDNANYVTSVHPAFYASSLHQHTDMLVYVPYFIMMDDVSEDFCLLPGVVFADRVVVQSERIRDSYIRHFRKWAGDIAGSKNCPQQFSGLEEKFLALGSAKLDRISRIKRGDSRLPVEWRKKIYAQDGSRKKVILYNTGVAALLHDEQILDKIIDTFSVLRSDGNVLLWWRPHPLYEATLTSMRPQLLRKYREIVSDYLEGNFGIYDVTSDLDRAIAESDAYYGDRSSLATLCAAAGKPVLIQNIPTQNTKDLEIPVWPSDFCVDGDDLWIIHGKINVLLKYNMSEKKTVVVGSVPGEAMLQQNLYSAIYKYKDRIFFVPCWGRMIAVYEITEKRFITIRLADIEAYENKILFCKAFANKKYLYCIPGSYRRIVRIDMEELSIANVESWRMPQGALGAEDEYINDAAQIDTSLVAAVFVKRKEILLFDMETENIELAGPAEEQAGYTSVAGQGGEIYLYDRKNNKIFMYSLINDKKKQELTIRPPSEVVLKNTGTGYFIADAVNENFFALVDLDGGIKYEEKNELERTGGFLDYEYGHGLCKSDTNDQDAFYYFNRCDNTMRYFQKNIPICQYKIELSKRNISEICNIVADNYNSHIINSENELINLNCLMKKVNCRNTERTDPERYSNGKIIFNRLINKVYNK